MEAIIFIGIQGSGKSTFYKERFFNSHVRVSMNLLKTRNRESLFIDLCLNTNQKLVIDNTNPTKEDRARYISGLKESNYKIIGYYFESNPQECLIRNNQRLGKERIPDKGVLGTYKKLELPELSEGFDLLYYVSIKDSGFIVEDYTSQIIH